MMKGRNPHLYNLLWVAFFAIWMAYLESAVVVYLRALYYPEGFHFPLKFIPTRIGLVEIGREAATLFMLLGIAFLAGRKAWTRLAFFMFSFGMWDIWYYIWLKVFLDWPESLLTWDILFLIPVPWVGPVLAPVLVSVSLIFGAIVVLRMDAGGVDFHLTRTEWIGLVGAALVIFITFILETPAILDLQIPHTYHWELFILGELLGLAVLLKALKRQKAE